MSMPLPASVRLEPLPEQEESFTATRYRLGRERHIDRNQREFLSTKRFSAADRSRPTLGSVPLDRVNHSTGVPSAELRKESQLGETVTQRHSPADPSMRATPLGSFSVHAASIPRTPTTRLYLLIVNLRRVTIQYFTRGADSFRRNPLP